MPRTCYFKKCHHCSQARQLGDEQASVLSTGCLEAYSNSAEVRVPERVSKLLHKVGSNSYTHDCLLIIDRRCYEKRGHKMQKCIFPWDSQKKRAVSNRNFK